MAPPPALMEELVEGILLRFPPDDPACLVRAALVCKPWCGIISAPHFRRKFRELHGTPPLLGFFCNIPAQRAHKPARFVPTTSFRPRDAGPRYWSAIDARHGRVLLLHTHMASDSLVAVPFSLRFMVWDPITDEQTELPIPTWPRRSFSWTATVLCAAACGPCDHLDCQRGPFLVVCVAIDPGNTFISTYSSVTGTWSEPISPQHHYDGVDAFMPSALARNTLYFGFAVTRRALKYDLESHEMSVIGLPSTKMNCATMLITMEDGVLGCAAVHESKLYIWSRKDGPQVDAEWTQNRVIDLAVLLPNFENVLHSNDAILSKALVAGYADGVGVIFLTVNNATYTIDLKTCKVKKVYEDTCYTVIPYRSFHTPALGAACTGEGAGA